MEKNKIALGKGLSTILGEIEETISVTTVNAGRDAVEQMAVTALEAGIYQPRQIFDEEVLNDLISSIREKGVIQPLLVRKSSRTTGKFEIIAGERRWRAAKAAGLTQVPVLVKDFSDRETLEVSLIENLQRQDLNPLEEAEGYARLLKEFRHTQEELSKVVGKSRSHVANIMRLLELPKEIQTHLQDGALSMGHARALLNAKEPVVLAVKVIEQGLNVRQTEQLAMLEGEKKQRAPKTVSLSNNKNHDILALEAELAVMLKANVTIKWTGKKGKIIIDCKNLEKLDQVLQRLTNGGAVEN